MPYSLRKMPRKRCYRVFNSQTKRVMSKCTSKAKAQSQIRLLRAIQYNKNFVPRTMSVRRTRKNKSRKMRGGTGLLSGVASTSVPLNAIYPPTSPDSQNDVIIPATVPLYTQPPRTFW